jgi:hypothetical protein
MDDIRDYLKEKFLPDDDATAERIARQSKRYAMVDGDLYRRGTDEVYLRCISREEGGGLLADIHEGECGSHSSSRTLVGKVFRHGFYWPIALHVAAELVRHCRASQFHAKHIHQLAQALHSLVMVVRGLGARYLGTFPKSHWGL